MNYLHEINLDIKTNYNEKEILEVLDKLFEILMLQYLDCDEFETEIKFIHTSIAKANKND